MEGFIKTDTIRASCAPEGLGFTVWGLGFRALGLGFRALGLGFLASGFRALGLEFRVSARAEEGKERVSPHACRLFLVQTPFKALSSVNFALDLLKLILNST